MRAIVVREFGGPDALKIEEVPDRDPGPSEVRVHMHSAGVNPVDTYILSGTYARKPTLPYTPGTDGAGEVDAVGEDVTDLKPGDRVYVSNDNVNPNGAGTYAEHAICSRSMVHHLPARVTFAQGAALGVPYATAYRALFNRGQVQAGETVLIHGATGGVGLAAVEFARLHGCRVIGSGSTTKGLDAVRERGAFATVNHREPGYLDAIMRATGGRGVDLILEMAAHLNLDKDLGLLARNGRVVVVGNRGRVDIDARQLMSRETSVIGMTLFNTPVSELASIHAAIEAGLAVGALNPIVGREIPLAEAPLAHHAVLEPGALGKIVLVP